MWKWSSLLRQVEGVTLGFASWPRDWDVQLGSWPLTSWSALCIYSLCIRGPLKSLGMGGFVGGVGLVAHRVCSMWGSCLPAGNLTPGRLVKLRQVGEGAWGFDPSMKGPESGVSHQASWSSLCSSRMCFRVLLRLQGVGWIGGFGGGVGLVACRVQ